MAGPATLHDSVPIVPTATAFCVQVAAAAPVFLLGPLALQMRPELGLDEANFGLIVGLIWASAALLSRRAGWMVGRLGSRRSMQLVTLCAGASSIGIAVAAHDFVTLAAFMMVDGVALAGVQVSTVVWLSESVPPQALGRAIGINQASGPTAALLAGAALPIVATTAGWRLPFVAAGLATIPIAIVVGVVRAPRYRAAHPQVSSGRTRIPLSAMVLMGTSLGLSFSVCQSFIVFVVSGAVDRGVTETAAGILYSIGAIGSIVLRLWLGRRADRRTAGHFAISGWMMVLSTAGIAVIAVGAPAIVMVALPLTFAVLWGWSGVFFLGVVQIAGDDREHVFGVVMTGAYLGAFLGPWAFGALARANFDIAWAAACATAMIAGVLCRRCEHLSPSTA